jgi:molybdopterin-guanine dinucleotide biosynthesis protein A
VPETGGPVPDVSTIILAGGASRRFGRDKALAVVPATGLTMIETAVQLGHDLGGPVYVSGTRRATPELTVQWVEDERPGAGPLGGAVSALERVQTGLAVVLAVDQPWLTVGLLTRLVDLARQTDAIVAFEREGLVHPMPFVISIASAASALLQAWHGGERSLLAGMKAAGLKTVSLDPASEPLLRDVDFPGEFGDFVIFGTEG